MISVFLNLTLKNKVILAKILLKISSENNQEMTLSLTLRMEVVVEEELRKFLEWLSFKKKMKNLNRHNNFRLILSSNSLSLKDLS